MHFLPQVKQEKLKGILSYNQNTGEFRWIKRGRNYGKVAGTKDGKYARIEIDRIAHAAHRLAWIYVNGQIPEGMVVDHIDGNKRNNRISNLRITTFRGNSRNFIASIECNRIYRRDDNGKWTAHISTINGVRLSIGSYLTEQEAQYVHDKIAPLFTNET